VGRWLLDDLVKCTDGVAELVGVFRWLTVGLDRNHQILVGNPDVARPIAKTFALVEPLRAERPENLVAQAAGSSADTVAIGSPVLVETS
jgi:hypothetical protein